MRVAVFTNQFPGKVCTFFARDMRGLIDAGVEVDIFPIYDLDASLWSHVPVLLNEAVLPRDHVHHLSGKASLRALRPVPFQRARIFVKEFCRVTGAALPHGPVAWAKSIYVFPKAWAWAREFAGVFDHVLAYWGNYSATCGYLFHRLASECVPFSIFVHAGTDLYRTPVYLREKLLYADRIITCIEFNRRFILERFRDIADRIKDRIVVSYHGLDLSEFPQRAAQTNVTMRVIGVGRFSKNKGFEQLIRAVGLLQSEGIDVECDLVGSGAGERLLRKLASRLHIDNKVHFHGWLPFPQVADKIREATVLVHPSTELGDGFPNVIKEAMALGTPVIGTEVAGIPEGLDFGRCGLLVPPNNSRALADGILSLLRNGELRLRLARDARESAEAKFDLWSNGRRLAEILRRTRRTGQRRVRSNSGTLPIAEFK